ncbi:hypothetical protein [Anabaena sp. CA = ATCC 33047]|uniref:hypothetical protein n=1 Tax=Anabaena sp. (strain CA / ATCC 33047) TaxID=52271 RepID=UPI0012ED5E68|nr:hypothetical protein [Anabaena sp. CA = ATCC 33047]
MTNISLFTGFMLANAPYIIDIYCDSCVSPNINECDRSSYQPHSSCWGANGDRILKNYILSNT